MDDLKTELMFRDIPESDIPAGITERKDKLHEFDRLRWEEPELPEAKALHQSETHLKKLLNAPFAMT